MAVRDFPQAPLEFGIFDHIEATGVSPSDVFEHKLQMVEAADRAGFYGWHIAEHQGTPLSLDVSPAVLLASAIQRTRTLRMGALTFCLPWYNPYRFYNEICMLDQLSGGRIELGVGRGVSMIEAAYYDITDVDESRERYRETLDIFMTACQTDVLNYRGKYHSYKDLELYNRPHQLPYPPLWFPSSDRNSIEFTASHGYNTVLNTPLSEVKPLYEQYREVWLQHQDDPGRHNGHVAAPKLGKHFHTVVGETDAEAQRLARAAHDVWNARITHLTRRQRQPDQLPALSTSNRDTTSRIVAGTAQTVLQELRDIVGETGINYLILVFSFGDLRPDYVMRSMELFNRDVMPALRTIPVG